MQTVPGFYQTGPVTNNTISKDQITEYNNIVNNYYGGGSGGSGSGSGDNNGGSSGGSWLDGILGFLGKIGDIIGSIVGKLLEIFGDILKLFGDVLMDVIDIIPSGFVEFLTAMFPFVPQEWITIVSFGLILMLIGVIIRMFK